jgi:hypothetical protein
MLDDKRQVGGSHWLHVECQTAKACDRENDGGNRHPECARHRMLPRDSFPYHRFLHAPSRANGRARLRRDVAISLQNINPLASPP